MAMFCHIALCMLKVTFKELHTDGKPCDLAIWKSGEPINLKGI